MRKQKIAALAAAFSLSFFSLSVFGTPASKATAADMNFQSAYAQYLSSFQQLSYGQTEISSSSEQIIEYEGSVQFEFTLPEDCLYQLVIGYGSINDNVGAIEYSLKLNGALPFSDCALLELNRLWLNSQEGFSEDREGNQLPNSLTESQEIQEAYVTDPTGAYSEPYLFAFQKGKNIVEIGCVNSTFRIAYLKLSPYQPIQKYDRYQAEHADKNGASAERIMIQAESPVSQNDKSIVSFCDKTSAVMKPVAVDKQVQNALGTTAWSVPGQKVTWRFQVEESGFYHLNIKYRQDYTGGVFVSRRLYIDGQVPFQESGILKFPFSSGWNSMTPSTSDGTPYSYYLEKGEHTISLECVLGDLDEVIRETQQVLNSLNDIYLRIIMLTGTNPDPLRDYLLDKKVPEVFSNMEAALAALEELKAKLYEKSGGSTQEAAVFNDLIRELTRFIETPEKVTKELASFQGSISALGTWIYSRYEQPLDLDYIEFYPTTLEPTAHKGGFFTECVYQLKLFFQSFLADYASLSEQEEQRKEITVWISSGRDQMQILKQLAENSFSPQYGIDVRVKLVQGALLQAVVAGIGPDVSVFSENTLPVNFAIRNAVLDLTQLEGFDEVKSRFHESAMTPFTWDGGVYAIPETQNFPVLFYRKDIMQRLGLEIPKTWSDVSYTLANLAVNNMQFGMTGLNTLLYQMGGEMYVDGGKASGLDSRIGIEAFRMWTAMYTDYGLPVSFDFANRFRSGEMPIAIADYAMANLLSVFAPEIRGQWGAAVVPGFERPDGTVDHSVASTSTGTVIIKDSKMAAEAWKFVKWWTSPEAQAQYGTMIEDRLGASSRYVPASIEAFEQMPWSVDVKKVIKEQWTHVKGTPEVPGSYYTDRIVNNAFRQVVYQGKDAREVLMEYVQQINNEISEKRTEFGLD